MVTICDLLNRFDESAFPTEPPYIAEALAKLANNSALADIVRELLNVDITS